MKKNWKNFVKKIVAVAVMACMLLTVTVVSSNEGIMPCGFIENEHKKL